MMISTHFGAAQPCFGPEIDRIIQFRRRVYTSPNGTSEYMYIKTRLRKFHDATKTQCENKENVNRTCALAVLEMGFMN